MSEQQKESSCDLAALLKNLPKEERLQIQGVIVGMELARKSSTESQRPRERDSA